MDFSCQEDTDYISMPEMCLGARPFKALEVSSKILKSIGNLAENQCKEGMCLCLSLCNETSCNIFDPTGNTREGLCQQLSLANYYDQRDKRHLLNQQLVKN